MLWGWVPKSWNWVKNFAIFLGDSLTHPGGQKWMCHGLLKMMFVQRSCQRSEQIIWSTFLFLQYSFFKVCFFALLLLGFADIERDGRVFALFIALFLSGSSIIHRAVIRISRPARWNVSGLGCYFYPQMCLFHSSCLNVSPRITLSGICLKLHTIHCIRLRRVTIKTQ